ncbi:MAG: hypothetical protein EOL87_01325 [Spartobacteria bacterium]|nr:hypothetical protein [Spartobacteria bacterium]
MGRMLMQYRGAMAFCRLMPRPFCYWVGLRLADMHYFRKGADYEGVLANVTQIYRHTGVVPGEDALDGMVRKTFQYFGKYLVDFFRFSSLTPQQVYRLFSVEHEEYLQQCLDSGRGSIFATAHFGNWEMGGAYIAAKGHDVYTVYLPERFEEVNEFMQQRRQGRGVHLIPLGKAASGLVRCLRNNQHVGLLVDRDFSHRDDRMMFFGKPARMPRGPSWLSWRTGSPILPGFVIRQVDDTFLIRYHMPLFPDQFDSEMEMRRALCDILEKEIAKNPCQWFLFDDFWANADRNVLNQVTRAMDGLGGIDD